DPRRVRAPVAGYDRGERRSADVRHARRRRPPGPLYRVAEAGRELTARGPAALRRVPYVRARLPTRPHPDARFAPRAGRAVRAPLRGLLRADRLTSDGEELAPTGPRSVARRRTARMERRSR